jgi:hypothetical protein
MPVKLNSTGGGSVTLTTPSTATDYTATFPANTGNVVTDSATQTLTNKTLTSPTIGGTPVMSASVITSGTAQASTSGTSIDFTGIPSWVKRVTVMFREVSINGTSRVIVQLGATTVTTSGYGAAGSTSYGGAAIANVGSGQGFIIESTGAAELRNGLMIFTNISGNTWCGMSGFGNSGGSAGFGGGFVSLGGTLDRVRITTVNGTDTFDAGSINILYE